MKIPEITINPFRAFRCPELKNALDSQEKAVKAAWDSVYSAITSGCHELAYWDGKAVIRPDFRSFMRYALHTSPRRNGCLQLSVMEMRNGEIIPTSHAEFDCVDDFIKRAISFGAVDIKFLTN